MDSDQLDKKILKHYPGLIVRKDLASQLKGAYPVPTYVLEFLLGRYCANPNEEVIKVGLKKVRETLEDHYLNPEKVEIIKSKIREQGLYTVLDRLKVRLVPSDDKYWGSLVSMNLNYIHVDEELVQQNERLLLDGVWGISTIMYDSSLSHRGRTEPFVLSDFKPVQLSSALADRMIAKRKEFNKDEWIRVILRSIGLEPDHFTPRQRMLLLLRLVPFVERNVNAVEFGPRSTGKSFAFRELSPHSILISGGGTSVANLFVSNVGTGKPGLVTFFDVVAFDEVAGLTSFKNSEELQIFKDYMESGSFSRGKGEYTGKASMVFVGNMDTDIQTALRTQHLFIPFPQEMQDLAFLDRFHIYLPGWELPRFTPKMFTQHFGFIVDLMAEYFQTLRNKSFYGLIEDKIKWGKDVDQRDKKRVRAVTSGLLKLIYPHGEVSLEDVEECASIALECRRRVKEQLRRMGSVEFRKTRLSYIRLQDQAEIEITTPEMQLSVNYSPLDADFLPGIGFTIGLNKLGSLTLYRIEIGLRKGRGTWNATGLAGKPIKEAMITVRDFLKANLKRVEPEIPEHNIKNFDVHVQVVDLMQAHQGSQTGLGFFISVVSKFLGIPIKPKTIIVGEMTISGALIPIQNLAEIILIAKECHAERILLPDNSQALLSQVPEDIKEDIEIIFFKDPIDAWNLSKSSNEKQEIKLEEEESTSKDKAENEDENKIKIKSTHSEYINKNQDDLSPENTNDKITFQAKPPSKEKNLLELPIPPTAPKKYECIVILDGSNIARDKTNSKKGSIKQVLRMRDHLIKFGIPNEQIYVIFGSGLRHHIPEEEKPLYQRLLQEENFAQAPAGQDDDYFIIEFALRKEAFIVTNDFYKDYKERHPDKRHFIRTHRISYKYLADEIMLEETAEKKLASYL